MRKSAVERAQRRGKECNQLRGRYDRASRKLRECDAIDDVECVHNARRARNLARNLARRNGCRWITTRGLGGRR